MTGFGRTGRWFGLDHWGVRPDLLVAAKGATSGYWPFGFVAAAGPVFETRDRPGRRLRPRVHVLARAGRGGRRPGGPAHPPRRGPGGRQCQTRASRLRALLHERLDGHERVGDIRGRGLMVGLELVADRATRRPYPRAARVTEAVVLAARGRGLLVYSGTGNANGTDGDTILLGPPFIVTDEELVRIADVLAEAVAEPLTVCRSCRPRGLGRSALSLAGRPLGTRHRTRAQPPARRAPAARPDPRPAARACSRHPAARAVHRTRPATRARHRRRP